MTQSQQIKEGKAQTARIEEYQQQVKSAQLEDVVERVVMDVAVDDGGRTGKFIAKNIATNKYLDAENWLELFAMLAPGSRIFSEKAAIMYDLLYHDAIHYLLSVFSIEWHGIPNEVVNTTKWDKGITGKVSDKFACDLIAEYVRKELAAGHSIPLIRTLDPLRFAALNAERAVLKGQYVIGRRCAWFTRLLPTVFDAMGGTIIYPADIVARQAEEANLLSKLAPFCTKTMIDKLNAVMGDDEVFTRDRLLGFLIPIVAVIDAGKGFHHFQALTGLFAHGEGTVWSADVYHNMMPAWIRREYGVDGRNPQMTQTPVASGKCYKDGEPRMTYLKKEYTPAFRRAFYTKLDLAWDLLLREVSTAMAASSVTSGGAGGAVGMTV